jgi:hypothetical protein
MIPPEVDMRSTKSSAVRQWVLRIVIAVSLVGLQAQAADQPVSPRHREAISTIAQYYSGSVDRADRLLRSMGYEPSLPPTVWRAFPPLRKVETAYLAAALADPAEGGDRLLALLSQSLALRYDAANDEKALVPYLEKDVDPFDLKFKTPKATATPEQLPTAVREAIATISDYCSSGMSARHVLTADFKVSTDEAYDILRSSASIEEALARGVSRLPETERGAAIGNVAQRLSKRYEAASYERSFHPFAPNLRPPEDPSPGQSSTGSAGGGPGSGGPSFGGPSAERTAPYSRSTPPPRSGPEPARVYENFVHGEYGGGGVGGFGEVVSVIEGFGGVVFGNTVNSALPPPTSVSYSPQKSELVVSFGSSAARYGPVSRDAAAAAARLVEGSPISWTPGQAIGLTSLILDDAVEYRTCSSRESSTAWNVALHPALVDLDIGWSTVMADVIPIRTKALLDAVRAAAGSEAESAVRDVVDEFDRDDYRHNWKVVDVPMTIESEDNRLILRRSDTDGFPEGTTRHAFITMNAFFGDFDKPHVDTDFTNAFYMIVPTLTHAFYDYRALNDFAAVLAIYRWAKASQATITPVAPTASKTIRTPEAITFDSRDRAVALRRIPKSAIAAGVWKPCVQGSTGRKKSR